MTELKQVLNEYLSLGINHQLDYDKCYLYSIITHSTAIEGSTVTEIEAQLLFDEGITSSKRTMTEQMMNLDLKNAYEYGIKWIKQHPEITTNALINLSSKVMEHTGSEYHTITGDFSAAKGELRKVNVTAGIGGASYMQYPKVPSKLETFCKELNERRKSIDTSDIISVYNLSFWAHYELVTIHPWADGNGRMSRLLMNLLQWEFDIIPSKVLKDDKAEYIQALVDSREKDDSNIFIKCMINLHSKNLKDDIQKYLKSIDSDVKKVAINSENSSDKVAIKQKSSDIILNYLKDNESINNLKAREITGLSSAGVRKIFSKLETEGLIAGFGENKGRFYKLK